MYLLPYVGLEEAKRSLELERSRLQGMMREMDRNLMEAKQDSGGLTGELEKTKSEIEAKKAEVRQLEARVASVIEERDRAQHQQHHLTKQVNKFFTYCSSCIFIDKLGKHAYHIACREYPPIIPCSSVPSTIPHVLLFWVFITCGTPLFIYVKSLGY